jgi:hypothetical protein
MDERGHDGDPGAVGSDGIERIETAAALVGRDRADDVFPVDLEEDRRAYVRIMTLAELELFQGEWDGEGKKDTMARIILATACDRAGNLLFRPDQLDDVRQIRARDALTLSNRSLEINRLTEEATAPLKKSWPEIIEND